MSDPIFNNGHDESFPFSLATCEVPAEVEARLRARLADFRAGVATRRRPAWRLGLLPAAHPVRWVAAAMAVAAAVLVWAAWPSGQSQAWAEVAKAAEEIPWIHAQGKRNGQPIEMWISVPRGVWALRLGQSDYLGFSSRSAKTVEHYQRAAGKLVRLPLSSTDEEDLRQVDVLFGRLFRGEAQADPSNWREKLVEQHVSEVEAEGRRWLDFQLTFQMVTGDRRRTVTYRVDPQTRLPKSCVEKPTYVDDPQERIDFDYPASGPADIYALGVPRDAKLVDQVPSPDLEKILAGMRAAPEKMDAYSGFIVHSGRGSHWSQAMYLWRVWRDGTRWRVEQSGPDLPGRWKVGEPKPALPADDVDRLAWWKAAAEKIQFYPVLVSDGKTSYRFTVKTEPERVVDWSKARFVVEAVEPDYMPVPRVNVGPTAGSLPEYISRPPLGIPAEGRLATLDLHPTGGPPGTILLRVSDERIGSPQQRVWIDPVRDFMAMRQELAFSVDSQGKPQNQVTEIVEVAQSPSGAWYPTVIHSLSNSPETGEDISESWKQSIHYYLDFTTPIPPEVFATPELKPKAKLAETEPRNRLQMARRVGSLGKLSQIAMAMTAYQVEHGHLPAASIVGPDGKTPHSWRVALLPYLGQKQLFDRYHLDEPWDSASNQKLLAEMPDVYRRETKSDATAADYFVLTGDQTLFPPGKGVRQQDLLDGLGNTLSVVEAKRDIPWTKPEDIGYDPAGPLPVLGGFDPDGFCAVFGDGSSRFIEPKQFDEATIRAWITPSGKENVSRPD